MGITAGAGTVVTATAKAEGGGGAAAYGAVDGITVLAANTGRLRWSRRLALDGQSVPAMVEGQMVVVTEADGTVIGLLATTGRVEWTDGHPKGCIVPPQDDPGLSPAVTLVDVAPEAGGSIAVDYQCRSPSGAGSAVLAGINPDTGAAEWRWVEPPGWSVTYQSPGASASGVLGVLVSGPRSVAPVRSVYRWMSPDEGTEDAAAIDETTGRPLWQVDGVPPSAGVYGGAGQLCVASLFGVDCRNARTGAEDWQSRPSAAPAHGGTAGASDGVTASGSLLYRVIPTDKATAIPDGSTTYRDAPGAFHLQANDIVTGRVAVDRAMPAWYGGPDGVVASVDSPPGIVGAGSGLVLVCPQLDETNIVEAFHSPASEP
jgi:hypothetical protein